MQETASSNQRQQLKIESIRRDTLEQKEREKDTERHRKRKKERESFVQIIKQPGEQTARREGVSGRWERKAGEKEEEQGEEKAIALQPQ